jgi:hypothetical protein
MEETIQPRTQIIKTKILLTVKSKMDVPPMINPAANVVLASVNIEIKVSLSFNQLAKNLTNLTITKALINFVK